MLSFSTRIELVVSLKQKSKYYRVWMVNENTYYSKFVHVLTKKLDCSRVNIRILTYLQWSDWENRRSFFRWFGKRNIESNRCLFTYVSGWNMACKTRGTSYSVTNELHTHPTGRCSHDMISQCRTVPRIVRPRIEQQRIRGTVSNLKK